MFFTKSKGLNLIWVGVLFGVLFNLAIAANNQITFNPKVEIEGNNVTVTTKWNGDAKSGAWHTDWIGLYHANDPQDAYPIEWEYVDADTMNGNIVFSENLAAGEYELRYYQGNDYDHVVSKQKFVVPAH